jgi:hypothetical protein
MFRSPVMVYSLPPLDGVDAGGVDVGFDALERTRFVGGDCTRECFEVTANGRDCHVFDGEVEAGVAGVYVPNLAHVFPPVMLGFPEQK